MSREGPREAAGSAGAQGQPLMQTPKQASWTNIGRNVWWFCFPEARNVFLRMSCQLPRMVLHVIMIALGQKNIVL